MQRCGRSSRTACQPCSETYRRRVRRIFLSGWSDNPAERLWLLTLTAPGERQHALRDGRTCDCTPDGGVNLPVWNAQAGKGFNRFVQDLRRALGDVEYCRAAEVQKRGALHFHVLVRCDSLGRSVDNPRRPEGEWWLRRLAIKHGFGHSVDLQVVRTEAAAGYCAKYASKSAADRDALPWLDVRTGEVGTGNRRYRPWSSSRRWSPLTMRALKTAQAEWVRQSKGGPAAGSAGDGGAEHPVAGARGGGAASGRTCPLDPRTANYTSGVYDRTSVRLECGLGPREDLAQADAENDPEEGRAARSRFADHSPVEVDRVPRGGRVDG
jgi:hypothetical protein